MYIELLSQYDYQPLVTYACLSVYYRLTAADVVREGLNKEPYENSILPKAVSANFLVFDLPQKVRFGVTI